MPTTFIDNQILDCGRIQWGSLERPAHVLWEMHESFIVPDSCRTDGTLNRFLGTVWFDDSELVAQAARLGMPAILGTFSLNVTNNQEVEAWTWTWRADGAEDSTLTFFDHPPGVPQTLSAPTRFFWFNGNQVSYYDNVFVEEQNVGAAPTAVGSMSEPMLYANGGVPVYAGTGVLSKPASFSGTIHRFSDLECKNEIPQSEW